jgi:hypothetical protein
MDDPTIVELDELDTELDRVVTVLTVARECGFKDVADDTERHIRTTVLPTFLLLAMVSDGEQRAEVAQRYQRLLRMLG